MIAVIWQYKIRQINQFVKFFCHIFTYIFHNLLIPFVLRLAKFSHPADKIYHAT